MSSSTPSGDSVVLQASLKIESKILHEGFKAMMEEPEFIKVISNMGLGIDYRSTEDYYALTDDTAARLAPVLESLLAIK